MKKNIEKPSPEAKALSLYLMAYKASSPTHKEEAKRINRLWDLVRSKDMSKEDYLQEVDRMLSLYGGYSAVIEKTVKFYIEKTGEWKLQGNDKYSIDAQQVADQIQNS